MFFRFITSLTHQLSLPCLKVKKSMRGIKFVLNERRIAYVGALEILAKKRVEFEQSTTIPELSPAQPGSTIAERPKKSAKAKQPS